MSVKAIYSGQIKEGIVHRTGKSADEVLRVLTNLEPEATGDGPAWTTTLKIGDGPSARIVDIALSSVVSRADYERSVQEPVFVIANKEGPADSTRSIELLALFRDRLFLIDRGGANLAPGPLTLAERDEMKLRVKRAVYAEEEELNSIRSYVANVEAAREFQQGGPKRETIPGDVKVLVWARDGGACVRCGSREKLHFDHIIPVVKGGGSAAENIQILCEPCNLMKSDKIGF